MSRTARTLARLLGISPQLVAGSTPTPQLASPFSPSADHLNAIVWPDLYGADPSKAPLTRAAAMAIPAVSRMRHLLCGTAAGIPLVSMTGTVRDAVQPLWMYRTDGELSPYHRMLWTVDDHLFHGWSLWAAARGAASDGSPLLAADRVPYHRWGIDADGNVVIDGEQVPASRVILLPGPHGGILNENPTNLRMALDNLSAASNASRNPVPNIDLHYTGEDDLDDEEIDAIVERWSARRRAATGGVGFTSRLVEAKPLGAHDAHLLIEGRNADAVDVARIGSIPASMLDATSAGASLTYTTDETRNQQYLDYGAKLYMDAIAARLSMDDVVPRGRRTAFDVNEFTTLTPTPTGAGTED